MKILHVIPGLSQYDGGPTRAVTAMCEALIANGEEVLLVTTDAGLNISYRPRVPTVFDNVPTMFFPTDFGDSFKFSWTLERWLRVNVAEFDVVHIHAVFNHSSIAAARACRVRGIPYVIRPLGSLDPWGMKHKSIRKRFFWYSVARSIMRHAAAIHYTSEFEKSAVEESLGLNHGMVIPLGVTVEADSITETEFSQQFPSLADARYIIVLSRLLKTKGLEELLCAFLSLRNRAEFRSWRLAFVGDGPAQFVNQLKLRVAQNLASDSVIFTGWLTGNTKVAALKHASLFALPSHHENFGLSVMEALACGVPALVSPQVNLASEIEAADAGWVCPCDEFSLEDTLRAALACDRELSRRGNNGKTLAKQYTWCAVADQLRHLYTGLVTEIRPTCQVNARA